MSWLWTALAVVVAVVMIRAAFEKLMGAPASLAPFTEFGWPLWIATLSALGEIVGAVALLIPATRTLGGLLLTMIMIVAAFTNISNGHPDYVWVNAALIVGSLTLAWQGMRRKMVQLRNHS
jgi:uncharacterized membrane protein YphA (DoxX/SURF4 family)